MFVKGKIRVLSFGPHKRRVFALSKPSASVLNQHFRTIMNTPILK